MSTPDFLDGLDADPWEKQQLAEVLMEIGDEYGYPVEDGPGGDDGPWDDGLADFEDAAAQMDAAGELDAQRLAQDVADSIPDRRPPSTEDKLQRAMDRIQAGTYLPDPDFRGDPPARNAYGRFASACGEVTDFGTCGARYHAADCGAVISAAAATGDATEAEAWRATLADRPLGPGAAGAVEALGLASPSADTGLWADLLQVPGGTADPGLHERMMAYLTQAEAEQDGPEPAPGQYPDVSALKEALGLL